MIKNIYDQTEQLSYWQSFIGSSVWNSQKVIMWNILLYHSFKNA